MNDTLIHKKINAIRNTLSMAANALAELELQLNPETPVKKQTYREKVFQQERERILRGYKPAKKTNHA